eukprot:scaffold19820_cov69-Phaeocystis_antarctica.AAC.2
MKRGRFTDSFGRGHQGWFRRKASAAERAVVSPSSSASVPISLSQEATVTSASSRVCFCCGVVPPAGACADDSELLRFRTERAWLGFMDDCQDASQVGFFCGQVSCRSCATQ